MFLPDYWLTRPSVDFSEALTVSKYPHFVIAAREELKITFKHSERRVKHGFSAQFV